MLDFPVEEYKTRVEKARRLMAANALDCLFLTSNRNIRYFAGFYTKGWINSTRPRFFLLPIEGEPVAIIPSGQSVGFRKTSWVGDVRTWPAPQPGDEGVSLIIDAVRSLIKSRGRLGAEIGAEMRLEMPIQDYMTVREALDPIAIVDCSPVIRPLRLVKSPAEIARMREMAEVASKAFAEFPKHFQYGDSERDVCNVFHKLLAQHGADELPYIVPVSGADGYHQINTGPSDRKLQMGDALIIDICASKRGYFTDFDRNFAIGSTSQQLLDTYHLGVEITRAGIESVRPGRTVADVFGAMARVLNSSGKSDEPPGPRWGHGVGLDSAEPPSIMDSDKTEIKPGMVLAIEPRLIVPLPPNPFTRVMYFEENVVATAHGCELLSQPAATILPII